MQDSQVNEIKNKLNVVDVVGSYVKLSKTGINYRGVCPFHSEKKPSFFVSPNRQMFKCFGCGKGGDIYEFVKEIEGVEFGDALKILAAKAGIELKRENPKLRTERQRLYEICDLSASFFEKQLEGGAVGKEAKEYLLKRGISEESIKKWRLGYSPDTWQSLSDFLVGKGYNRQEIVKAGLAVSSEKGNSADWRTYDRFRGRIIFPIFDSNSQVIGFGARVFKKLHSPAGEEKEVAKYINTPQTLLYDKSSVLYGMNNAKLQARKKNHCVIVEGYTDAIMCHQAGFENTVAASGTALTPQHLNILKRYTENLVLAFDMDLAGDSATKRGINLAEAQGFNIKVINAYSEKDPADIILEDPKIWEKSLEQTRLIMDYYFDSAFAAFDKNTPEGKKQIGKIVLPAVKRLGNKIEQSHWVQKLSQRLSIREDAIIEELKSIKLDSLLKNDAEIKSPSLDKQHDATSDQRKKLIEDKIVALVIKDPENLNLIEEPHYSFFCEKTKTFLDSLKSFTKNQAQIPAVFAEGDENLKKFLDAAALRAEVDFSEDGSDEIQLCLLQLKDIYTREKLCKISEDIKQAEQSGDRQKASVLINDFSKLIKEL